MTDVDTGKAGGERWPVVTAVGAVVTVAVVAAVVSYMHMREVAEAAGEEWRAILLPLSVDGMVIAATLNAWQAKKRQKGVPAMTLVALVAGLLVSIAANVAVPFLDVLRGQWLSAVVAAWPPIALAISFEELIRMLRQSGTRAAVVPERAAVVPERAAVVPDVVPERQGRDQGFAAEGGTRAAGNVRLPLAVDDCAAGGTGAARDAARVPERAAEQTAGLPVVPGSGDDREAARELVRQDPDGWTGARLAERFGRSERWGRAQIAAVRAEQVQSRRSSISAVK